MRKVLRRGWRDDVKETAEARDRAEEDGKRQKGGVETGGGETATAAKQSAHAHSR
jgi:hypothetical protein